jgi:hypothetical protein
MTSFEFQYRTSKFTGLHLCPLPPSLNVLCFSSFSFNLSFCSATAMENVVFLVI